MSYTFFVKKGDKNKFEEDNFISYLVCHLDKYHRNDIVGVERENERDETYISDRNPQIDCSRTCENFHTIKMEGTYKKCINSRLKELNQKRKIKDDAVLMCSFILGSDKDFFDGLSAREMHEFFRNVTDFFEERYGTENILSAVVHLDETTPHMHINLIPVFEGRLCAKKLFDRVELRELQSEFHEKVGKKWGLKRGKIGSTAKHLKTMEFKAKKIIEGAELQAEETKKQARQQADEIKAEDAPYHEALNQALNGNYAWTPGGLKKQAIAATAETIKTKKENEYLTRRLDASMSETLHYARKADAAEQREAKGNRAIELLAKLQRENPEAFEQLIHPTPKPKANNNFKF